MKSAIFDPDYCLAPARAVGSRAAQMLRPAVARSEATAECVTRVNELILWLTSNT